MLPYFICKTDWDRQNELGTFGCKLVPKGVVKEAEYQPKPLRAAATECLITQIFLDFPTVAGQCSPKDKDTISRKNGRGTHATAHPAFLGSQHLRLARLPTY